jgi:hypothetical protein
MRILGDEVMRLAKIDLESPKVIEDSMYRTAVGRGYCLPNGEGVP